MMFKKQPLVSIIMNCYNGDDYLKEAIDSVYNQTYPNWEIIFWDNASTDKSASIANSYDKKIKYYLSSKTEPLGKARNLALEKARGEYLSFLDCDDIYLPTKLECQVKLMNSNKYFMCYGSTVVINENGKEIKKHIVKNRSGSIFSALLRRYEINMQTVMLKRDYILKNNLSFNTKMSYCPDHNLFMIIASEVSVGVITEVIAKYRKVNNSLSKKTINLAPIEYRLTLDEISEKNPQLREKLSKDFKTAYNKAIYYEVIADIFNNNTKKGRLKLKKIFTTKVEYFLLYILMFVPLPKNILLRVLGR